MKAIMKLTVCRHSKAIDRRRKIAIFLVCCLALASPAAGQQCVVAFPEKLGSWASVHEGHYVGPLVDAATEIFAEAMLTIVKHPVDRWSNILEQFEAGKIDILAVAMRTSEREKTMQFVGPWINYRWGPFYLTGSDALTVEHPKVGVNRALKGVWPIPAYLTRLHGEAVWDTPEELMNKLTNGAIDVVLGEYQATLNRASELDVDVTELPNTNMRLDIHMAVNKNGACVNRAEGLDRAIRVWKRNGGQAELMKSVQGSD